MGFVNIVNTNTFYYSNEITVSKFIEIQETQGSMHSFSSIYTALIKTFSVSFSVLRIVYCKPYEKI